jgi:hypothetical protein
LQLIWDLNKMLENRSFHFEFIFLVNLLQLEIRLLEIFPHIDNNQDVIQKS